MTEVEHGQRHGRRGALVAPCYDWSHFYYPLLIVNKNDLHEKYVDEYCPQNMLTRKSLASVSAQPSKLQQRLAVGHGVRPLTKPLCPKCPLPYHLAAVPPSRVEV